MKNIITLWVSVALFIIGGALPAHAQESCGSIIAPEYWGDLESPLTTTQIIDCSDPFQKSSMVSSYTLIVNSVIVGEGSELLILDGKVTGYEVSGWVPLRSAYSLLFFHDGNNYRFINMNPSVPVEADYRRFAGEYFTDGTDVEQYIAAALDSELRFSMDYDMRDTLYGYLDYVDQHFVPQFPTLTAGTYTLVTHEYELMVTKANFLQKLFARIIPTAHAQTPETTYTLTFTVKTAEEPTGASSVLFIPGIQASRLYTDGVLGTENQLWEPNRNKDTELLTMSSDGESLEHVYTRDVVDSIPFVGTVYEEFISFLEERKLAPFPIKEYLAFAYDWRYSVTDIAENGTQYEEGTKSLVAEVDRLATDSYTKKVTIIAHSNGGLLAKALLTQLETLGKVGKVDRVILLASPQLGTPKAVATVLHGYDQKLAKGLILNPHDARILVHNMPGVYGLLPSEKYFDGQGDPLISFDDSSIVEPYVERYGTSVDSYDEYVEFMRGDGWSSRSIESAVSNPAETNSVLFDDAQATHSMMLDTWHAPTGVEVVEIVGTGLPTVKGIEYTGVIEGRTCGLVNGVTTCVDNVILKPYVQLTKYGDQTVVQRSAEAYEGVKKKFFVNLKAIDEQNIDHPDYVHYNISEIEQVQELIQAIILATTTSGIRFVSEEYTAFDDVYNVEIIDSPVRMVAEDGEGRQTGVVMENGEAIIREDIPGSQYIYLGDTKYLVIPKGTDHTTTLYGEAEGHFTLTTAVLDQSDTQIIRTRMENVTTTPTMVAQYTEKQDVYTSIRIDNEGDGVIDTETDLNGEPLHTVYTYANLYQAIHALTLKKSFKKILIQEVSRAERVEKLKIAPMIAKRLERVFLELVMKTVRRYEHKRLITATEADYVEKIIQSLIDKK